MVKVFVEDSYFESIACYVHARLHHGRDISALLPVSEMLEGDPKEFGTRIRMSQAVGVGVVRTVCLGY